MDILKGLILGIVQGITEFLPVSSSGHLLLLEKITGISENDGGAFFTTMLHLATLVAVVIVYRKLIWKVIRYPKNKLLLYLVIATVPTVIIALSNCSKAFKYSIPRILFGCFNTSIKEASSRCSLR